VVDRYAKNKEKELTDETWELILKAEREKVSRYFSLVEFCPK